MYAVAENDRAVRMTLRAFIVFGFPLGFLGSLAKSLLLSNSCSFDSLLIQSF